MWDRARDFAGLKDPRDDTGNRRWMPADARATNSLKRYVFVGDGGGVGHIRLGSALVEIGARSGGAAAASGRRSFARLAPAAQQDQVLGHDLCLIVLLPVLVVPGAGLQPALDVNRAPFLQVLARDLRRALPGHDVVPLGAVLPLAVFIFVALVGG